MFDEEWVTGLKGSIVPKSTELILLCSSPKESLMLNEAPSCWEEFVDDAKEDSLLIRLLLGLSGFIEEENLKQEKGYRISTRSLRR